MKKLIISFLIALTCGKTLAVGSFLAGLHDKRVALGSLLTTTTTSCAYGFLTGIVSFGDNGEAFVSLDMPQAQDALKLAVQKSLDGEELSNEDKAILEIYATQTDNNISLLIEKVSADL